MVGKGFYGVHDKGDLSFGVGSITVCQGGSPITCVLLDFNVKNAGIFRTQNGEGVILRLGHRKLFREHTEDPWGPTC